MTGGEALGGILLSLAAVVHSVLNGWVDVTSVAGSGGTDLAFSVRPEGIDFAQWAANTMAQWASLVNGVVHIPLLTADIVSLLLELVS